MKTITGKLLRCALAVLVASALLMGCASRGEFADRQTGGIDENATRTVGAVKAGYADLNGLKMYYEIQGNGRPLVLIHGGVCTIETCFGKVRPPLARNWKTVAVELQGHGHTAWREQGFVRIRRNAPQSTINQQRPAEGSNK
jgi:hypothetical protein